MSLRTFDYPWATELYNMQWEYPYVLDVAYTPQNLVFGDDGPDEMKNRDYAPQTESQPDVADTTQQPAQTGPAQSVQEQPTAPPPQPQQQAHMPVMGNNGMMKTIKPFVVPALIIVAGVVIYNIVKRKKE